MDLVYYRLAALNVYARERIHRKEDGTLIKGISNKLTLSLWRLIYYLHDCISTFQEFQLI